MERMKMVLIWCIPLVLITAALVTPAVAQTPPELQEVLRIWPDQLIPTEPNREYSQTVAHARNNVFYAPLDLPKEVKINSIIYYHYGIGDFAWTHLKICRAKFGQPAEILGESGIVDMTGKIIQVLLPVVSDKTVRKGYRYFIEVESNGANAFFMGVEIGYQKPKAHAS